MAGWGLARGAGGKSPLGVEGGEEGGQRGGKREMVPRHGCVGLGRGGRTE